MLVTSLAVVLISCSNAELKTSSSDQTEAITETTVAFATTTIKSHEVFSLSSSAMTNGGAIPTLFTCDGQSVSPPLEWSQGPAGTKSYAILMDHQPGLGDWKWYWQVWNIDASIMSISEGATDVGVLGGNEMSRTPGYGAPCSKGPGAKEYNFHVYALSSTPIFSVSPGLVTREMLLVAIQPMKLAEAIMSVTNTRS